MTPVVVSVLFKCGHTVQMYSPGRGDPTGAFQTNPTSDKLCGDCLKKAKLSS